MPPFWGALVFLFNLGCVSLVHFHGCFLLLGKPDLLEFSALLPRVVLALDAQLLRWHRINSLHSSDHPVLQSLILVLNLLSFEQLLLQLRSWLVDLSAGCCRSDILLGRKALGERADPGCCATRAEDPPEPRGWRYKKEATARRGKPGSRGRRAAPCPRGAA